jgi:hypothetical protein
VVVAAAEERGRTGGGNGRARGWREEDARGGHGGRSRRDGTLTAQEWRDGRKRRESFTWAVGQEPTSGPFGDPLPYLWSTRMLGLSPVSCGHFCTLVALLSSCCLPLFSLCEVVSYPSLLA